MKCKVCNEIIVFHYCTYAYLESISLVCHFHLTTSACMHRFRCVTFYPDNFNSKMFNIAKSSKLFLRYEFVIILRHSDHFYVYFLTYIAVFSYGLLTTWFLLHCCIVLIMCTKCVHIYRNVYNIAIHILCVSKQDRVSYKSSQMLLILKLAVF